MARRAARRSAPSRPASSAALATIVDANVTTFIAAVVLFGVGSGPVRGFAVTLALGIITTMFTAFTLSPIDHRLLAAAGAVPRTVPL